ncbi:MAG: hypothetical protein PVH99_12810, partial [Desulfobacteraceae bacterium]
LFCHIITAISSSYHFQKTRPSRCTPSPWQNVLCSIGSKRSYYSYELNLVLRDSKRTNVMDHGDYEKLREDAQTLSQFLEKPVWDAI